MSDGIVASCNENSDKCILLFSNSTEPSLKNWVYDQRNLYNKQNKKYFNHEKIDLLNKKNFIWDVHEFIWNIRLNELREFRGKHGHCIVSRSYKHLPNLGLWVYNQRNRKQNQEKDTPLSEVGSLTNKQIKYLDDLNFVWNTDEAKWLEKFNALKDFYNKNGHTHLADSNCTDKSLVYWVKRQRRECTMENRKKMLDSIEFIWSFSEAREDQWLKKFNQLKEFYQRYGHTQVTQSNCSDKSLVNWVGWQRFDCNIEKRKQMLDSVEFNWPSSDAYEAKWLEKFNQLKLFQKKNGHTQVTNSNCTDKSLVNWTVKQRFTCKRKERIKLLDSIGFVWSKTHAFP